MIEESPESLEVLLSKAIRRKQALEREMKELERNLSRTTLEWRKACIQCNFLSELVESK